MCERQSPFGTLASACRKFRLAVKTSGRLTSPTDYPRIPWSPFCRLAPVVCCGDRENSIAQYTTPSSLNLVIADSHHYYFTHPVALATHFPRAHSGASSVQCREQQRQALAFSLFGGWEAPCLGSSPIAGRVATESSKQRPVPTRTPHVPSRGLQLIRHT